MKPKKTACRTAAALVVPLLIVSVSACGGDDGSSASEGGSPSSSEGGFPPVTGDVGKEPKIAKGEGDPPEDLKTKVLKEGKGEKVKKGDALTADYLGRVWDGAVFDNSWDRGEAGTFEIGTGKVIKGWDKGLVGQKLGSRVELVIPPEQAYGDQPPQGSDIGSGSTLVFVVDLKKTKPTKIDGQPVKQRNPDLPKVGDEIGDRAPEIEVPKGKDAPEEITSETVIRGDGREVGEKSTIFAHFTAVLWNDGKPVGGTWQQGGPQEIPVAGTEEEPALPGWEEGLKGQKAGSRVLIVVPEDELTKKQKKQLKSPVVFAVDVISVDD
jgi:FKBP-type peptidyl-prolyl cis-trans isomerase